MNSLHEPRIFELTISNFSGPFEVLLHLISSRELDLTTVALSEVTDEFIAFTRALGDRLGNDLSTITEFLVIAATLIQLKASRLVPTEEPEDAEALALLEARDVLFARLLQYRAYRAVAGQFAAVFDDSRRGFPAAAREVDPTNRVKILPASAFGITLQVFASIATDSLAPRPIPEVTTAHMQKKAISVSEQARLLYQMLCTDCSEGNVVVKKAGEWWEFTELVEQSHPEREMWVARFLAIMRLHSERKIECAQAAPLASLHVKAVLEE